MFPGPSDPYETEKSSDSRWWWGKEGERAPRPPKYSQGAKKRLAKKFAFFLQNPNEVSKYSSQSLTNNLESLLSPNIILSHRFYTPPPLCSTVILCANGSSDSSALGLGTNSGIAGASTAPAMSEKALERETVEGGKG